MTEKHNTHQEDYSEKQSSRMLGYSFDFKNFVRENPGFLSTAKKLISDIESGRLNSNEVHEANGVLVNRPPYFRTDKSYGYRVEFDGQSFFVKTPRGWWGEGGKKEFDSSKHAEEILKDIPWVDVVEFQLGYTDIKGKKYFVSKWVDGPVSLYDYRAGLMNIVIDIQSARTTKEERNNASMKIKNIDEKIGLLRSRLKDFWEVADWNMFYDVDKDRIILFDLYEDKFK